MITDNQKELLIQQYYDRGVLKKEIRSYEVSLWTLQDEFITVLKWSDVEQKGRIESPKMTLNIDGTEKFTFSIPMYYRKNGKLVENPNWYNVQNDKNLMVGMRKLKVIFNKDNPEIDNVDWRNLYDKIYVPANYNGNVNLFNRPIVPASKFIEAGWDEFGGTYGTLYSKSFSYTIEGKEYDIIYTPVSMNGGVTAPAALTDYMISVISSGSTVQDKLDYDASHSKLLLGIYEVNSDNHNQWAEELHEMQAEWDIIRAKNGWFGYNSNPYNIEFDESNYYYYYQKYLRSINTFEFIITNVTETHERDILTCEIESEGLAFQELGKIGYKISLSLANFELVYKEWETDGEWTRYDGTKVTTQPIQNVQYWCEEAGLEPVPSDPALINSRVWYYDIQMNWDAFADGKQRDPHVVYEEAYTSSWDSNLRPLAFENSREKARSIEVENSNLYNITKTIAEKFEIFCKYEYMYDENYHIIGRKVIFYNNFMQDGLGSITLQYPYSSSKISRTMDSTAITTKLFVLDVDEHGIADAEPNASREDYILNFDFLYQTGAITQEQYDAIQPYYKDVRAKNDELINLQNQLIIYQEQQPEIAAKKTVLENSKKINEEQINANSRLATELGVIELTAAKPDYLLIHKDENGSRYVNLSTTNKGIMDDSITVWATFGYDKDNKPQLSNQITGFTLDHDGANNLTTLTFTQDTSAYTNVYLLYKYDPKLYYDNVIKIWETKAAQDELDFQKQTTLLEDINEKIDSTTSEIERVLREKEQIVKAFERLMGPALREGYWQPEDYDDYGDRKISNISLSTSVDLTRSTGKEMKAGWDSELFTGEQKLYYQEGVNEDKIYYPCINLKALFNLNIPTDLSDYSIVWKATNRENYSYDWTSIKDLRVLSIGSSALIRFINYGNEGIIPVLVVTGAQAFTDKELERLTQTGEARLEKYSVNVDKISGATSVSHGDNQKPIGTNWIIINKTTDETTYPIVQPRIKNSAMTLKTDANSLFIKYGNNTLSQFSDYYINTRIGKGSGGPEYYITIKPEVLIKYGLGQNFNINYILSNANTAIYLDARKVSQENAYPKVSYSIDVNLLNTSLLHTLYSKLARIVMVNDTDLKFENTFGYISQVDLDLDNCQNDTVEIKNYKTKFEDLFSTIVAQTEDIKRSGAGLTTALSGGIPLSEDGFVQTMAQHKDILDAYLDSHFDSSQVVRDRLTDLFSEAGDILGGANKTLNKLKSLTLGNAGILSRFAENVAIELTTKVYRSTEKPASFKPGDIWIYTDEYGNEYRYLAMTDSSLSGSGSDFGFVRTHDGSLASIRGANVAWDAEAGIVDITGENEINIRSGKNLYLAANADVNIVGNKSVNIGGSTINIGAGIGAAHFTISGTIDTTKFKNKTNNEIGSFWFRYKDGHWTYKNNSVDLADYGITISVKANQSLVDDVDQLFVWNRGNDNITWMESNNDTMGSINLVASGITQIEEGKANTELAKVLISPYKIEMGAAELELKASSTINLYASQGQPNNTSAISINADEGVWIGAGAGVRLFSGNVKLKTDGTIDTSTSGANIELNHEHLILGYSSGSNAQAIEMNKEYLIIAAGNIVNSNDNKKTVGITGTSGGLVGAKFTSKSIGFATGSGNNINAILMDNNGVTIGGGSVDVTKSSATLKAETQSNLTATSITDGSYVRIGSSGIELGSLADLYINTTNFKLQTNSRAKENNQFIMGNTILAIGNNLQNITESTRPSDLIEGQTNVDLLLNKNGLYIRGTVYASAGSFTGNVQATSLTIISSDANDIRNQELQKLLTGNIQQQIDDEIQTWTGKGTPVPFGKRTGTNNGANWDNSYTITDLTTNTSHVNHNEWNEFTSLSATAEAKGQHIGDIYYDIATESESKTAGAMYRWIRNNNDYYWMSVGDTVSTKTLELVANARADLETIFALGRPLGNYFDDDLIYGVNLNTRNGLLIMGNESSNGTIGVFRANHTTMGFFNMEASKVSSSFAYDSTNGLYISSESNFTRDADALLYYKDGNMYISGTLFADDIRVKNRNASGNGVTFDNYLKSSIRTVVSTNLVDDSLTAASYWTFLTGGYSGVDDHVKSQEYWTNLTSTVNTINSSYATSSQVGDVDTKANNIINGNTGLAFSGVTSSDNIYSAQLNKANGLLIEGYIDKNDTSKGTMYLKITHGAMGFFKKVNNSETSMMYFDAETGDMALKGVMYAKTGWFGGENGFIISTGSLESKDKTVLIHTGTAAGNTTATATFALQKLENGVLTPVLSFINGNLSVTGDITATSGTFTGTVNASGGWFGADSGWLIGGDAVVGSTHTGGRIYSANGKVILAAGNNLSGNDAIKPFLIFKDNNNNNIFEYQDGHLALKGTIHAIGGWFGSSDGDGWVIGGDVNTNQTTVTLMDGTTFTTSGSRLQSANNKIILNAGNNKSGNDKLEPYLIMRKDSTDSNGNAILEDVFEYYNGTLAIKGTIYATNFYLGTSKITTTNGKIDANCINVDKNSFSFSGIGSTEWNGTEYEVALLSKTSMLIGANGTNSGGIIIARDSSSVAAEINKERICLQFPNKVEITNTNTKGEWEKVGDEWKFKVDGNYKISSWIEYNSHWYYVDADGNMLHDLTTQIGGQYYYFDSTGIACDSSILLTDTGLDITGNRLRMNGLEAWGRDDIIVMKRSGESQSAIETRMSGKHDWVLIKPYYDARIEYLLPQDPIFLSSEEQYYTCFQKDNTQLSFGSNATWYQYSFSCRGWSGSLSNGSVSQALVVTLVASDGTTTRQVELSNNRDPNKESGYAEGSPYIWTGALNKQGESGVSISGDTEHISTNLCQEGWRLSLYISFIRREGGYAPKLQDITVTCTCDATTSRVPCTVYYYP